MQAEGEPEQLPQPEVSGSQLSQAPPGPQPVVPIVSTLVEGGVGPFELSDALRAVPEIRGQAGMLLLHGHAVRLERETQQLRLERNQATAESNHYRDLYHNERVKASVLSERIHGLANSINLRSFVITVGSLLLGVSIPLASEHLSLLPVIGGIAGIGLMIVGWWLKPAREDS